MPRGPFQGTFQPNLRPTIVTAPDALVMINGESETIGCPSCRRRFDFNKYITSIQVDLSVEGAPGSASINLSIPRHTIDDFYFDGVPVLTPMMEIEIYAKGYYLVEGIPQYYPIFWGLITEVGDNYSSGEHTVSIHCADILKWWELCKMNVNPAFTAPTGQNGRNIFGNVFFGANPYDVIWTLAQQSFGDVIIGTGSLTSVYKDSGSQRAVFNASFADMMVYWEERFRRLRSNLLLYGVNGVAVRGDSLYESYRSGNGKWGQPFASKVVATANGGPDKSQFQFDPTDPSVVAFRTQFSQAGQVNFWQSEYQTKLELANAAKESIGFEFYMDVTGDIVFKPPFYNLDIISNKPVSWIQDIDIIEWDFSESEAEVVTQVQLQGSFGGAIDYGMPAEVTPFTSVTDYHLLRKYGWRTHTFNSEFMGDPQMMFYHGLDLLDRLNSKRHRGTVGIPLRPELRLGFPIYIAPKDQVWYISGISHNIAFGGRAQTTLTLTAKRQKFIAPRGIALLDMTSPPPTPSPSKAPPKSADGTKQKQAPAPQMGLPFAYSATQLSKGGVFRLKIGDAAQLPPTTNDDTTVTGSNPNAPLILRHPKTGRIVGYPNVVMAYTRPFFATTAQLKKIAGQGDPKKREKVATDSYGKALDDRQSAVLQATDHDRLIAKHLTNRYQYGLNSAGVYVYAYDVKKVIGEMVVLPSARLTTDPATVAGTDASGKPIPAQPFLGSSAMIRPVSDERGFEVIGHYRYGRGLALRDGQLVYNNGPKDSKASVNLQVALSGDVFASLQAQSAGLTAIISAYPNPVATLSRLEPEDLQTAGIDNNAGTSNPSTSTPEFVPAGTSKSIQDGRGNFVDNAPLGSPEQVGLTASVEASTLSRALTLAEMAVLDSTGSQDAQDNTCMCLLGRSDLAFINTGYQIKVLKGTVPDSSTLFSTSGSTSGTTTVGGSSDITAALGSGAAVTGGATPVQPSMVVPPVGQTLNLIDQFLFDLYSALDAPHQAYEAQIRGDNYASPGNQEFDSIINGGTGALPSGSFTPPFSSVNRSALGDPVATAQQGSSAADSISQSWAAFGTDLKSSAKRTLLLGQIAQDQATLAQYNAQLQQLQTAQASGTVTVGVPSVTDQIASLEQKISDTQKDLASKQLQLAQISVPTTGG